MLYLFRTLEIDEDGDPLAFNACEAATVEDAATVAAVWIYDILEHVPPFYMYPTSFHSGPVGDTPIGLPSRYRVVKVGDWLLIAPRGCDDLIHVDFPGKPDQLWE